jgi:soluble lytic murein transglycosylase
MRRRGGWLGWLAVVTACAAAPHAARTSAQDARPASEPLVAGLVTLRGGGDLERAARLLAEAGEVHPPLADYALYFRTRAALAARRRTEALELATALPARHPDSIWVGPAHLVRAQLLNAAGDLPGARAAFSDARAALPHGGARWVRATLGMAEVDQRLGDAESALDLAREIRTTTPGGLATRRARRLGARIHAARPDLPVDHVEEAEMRLREGDAAASLDEAETALASDLPSSLRSRALWTRVRAERALGRAAAAEAGCLALAAELPGEPLAPRALAQAATWHWNADDDAGASRLFSDVARRFPDSEQAPEALYGIGRIAQEAGRYEEARATYEGLADRYPHADLASEARWRAAWVRWLEGQVPAAEQAFARVAARAGSKHRGIRAGAEYWRARALERLGREDEARERLEHVAEHHSTSFYAGLAEERLGRKPPDGDPPPAVAPPSFPAELAGAHAERARLLDRLGLRRFARLELDAASSPDVPRRSLVQAYEAIGAFAPALRLAHVLPTASPAPPRPDLYPLGYWDVVRPTARARNVDPLLVLAVIRQESLFDPEAVSPAGARGLMQLLPATARRIRQAEGGAPPTSAALADPVTNVDVGVALLARLLATYNGSAVKALAAYNGGEDAVAKWERRYAGREPDEFVELISFRETRDYVKAVLRNYRLYRMLYAAPSASTTSVGSPPKAPLDMMTTTSPRRALPTT